MPPSHHPGNFFRYFLLSILAICLGGATLIAGAGAGATLARRLYPEEIPLPAQARPHNGLSFGPSPTIFPIVCSEVDFTNAIEAVRSAVVSITISAEVSGSRVVPQMVHGSGSGFIFDVDDQFAFIATNHHVVENASRVMISLDDDVFLPARPIGNNPENDLAVLTVPLSSLEEMNVNFSVAALGSSNNLRMGDSVVAMGNALGEGQRTTQGIVSALDLFINIPNPSTGNPLELHVFQTDAAVNRGNSGGPLVNEAGEVVGIITAKFMGTHIEGMGYALPIDHVRSLLESMREVGSVIIPFMGINHIPINEATREQFNLPHTGQLVQHVTLNTPAHDADLRRGDLIIYFGGIRTYNFEIFREALMAHSVGETVVLGIYRGDTFMELEITLGTPPN